MADKIYLKGTFAFREDTLANWKSYNPILEKGEPSIVRDGNETEWLKIGDGITPWNDLPWKKIASSGGSGDNITVDQTYNPESPNAQSGKAVAEALKGIDLSGIDLSGKMDKFGEVTDSTIEVPDKSLNIANINVATLQAGGCMVGGKMVATTNYVDTAIGNIDSALDSIIAIQNSILGGGA